MTVERYTAAKREGVVLARVRSTLGILQQARAHARCGDRGDAEGKIEDAIHKLVFLMDWMKA